MIKPDLGLACPACGYSDRSYVKDTRPNVGGIRRRRLCACGARFTTLEHLVERKEAIAVEVAVRAYREAGEALLEAAAGLPEAARAHYLGRAGVMIRRSKEAAGLDLSSI